MLQDNACFAPKQQLGANGGSCHLVDTFTWVCQQIWRRQTVVCWRPRRHSGGWGKDSSCQLKSSQSKKNTSHGPMIWDWSFGDPQAFFRRFHHIVQTFSLRFGRWLAGSSLWHSHLHKQTQNRQASIHANTHGSRLVVPSLQVILIYARPLVFEHSGPTDPPNQKEIKDCLSGHMLPRKKNRCFAPQANFSLKKQMCQLSF